MYSNRVFNAWLWIYKNIFKKKLSYRAIILLISTKTQHFGLVGFYGISTVVGHLVPNSLYTYILNI